MSALTLNSFKKFFESVINNLKMLLKPKVYHFNPSVFSLSIGKV